jgi:hypothetical protein
MYSRVVIVAGRAVGDEFREVKGLRGLLVFYSS